MATNQHLLNTAINAFNIQKLSSDLPFTRDINDLAVFTLAAWVLWPDSILYVADIGRPMKRNNKNNWALI